MVFKFCILKILFWSENVYTNLNYAVFLYNQGDRQAASNRLVEFRKNFDAILQGKRRDIDPEVRRLYEIY